MNPTSTPPLVVRFGAFGDMVLMIPVLKLLRERYGQPCDVVSSGPWTEPLLSRVSSAGQRVYLTSRRAPYWFNRSQQDFVRWLKKRPAGPVYVFEPDEKPLALLRRGGVALEWICTWRDLPREPREHILAHAFRLARQTPPALAGKVPEPAHIPDARPEITDADRRECDAWLAEQNLAGKPIVLIQAGNKKTMRRGPRQRASNLKYWPEERWAAIVAGVHAAMPTAGLVLCGSPSERALIDDIRSRVPATVPTAVASGILRVLALQERAHSMISVDTGPAHSAAALGCPLTVLFASPPDLYAPIPTTADVRILRPENPSGESPLLGLTPETVLAAWQELAKR